MDTVSKQIVQDVDSGKYFSESREWYNSIFIKPVYESATMYLYTMFALGLISIVLINLYSLFPNSREVTVVTKLSNTISYYPKLQIIQSNDDKAIIKYIVSNYIKARESYKSSEFRNNYVFAFRNSSKDVFAEYQKEVETSNTNSPLIKYGWEGYARVEIVNVDFLQKNNIKVRFTKKGYDKYNRLVMSKMLEADIKYKLDKIDFEAKKKKPINFMVNSYQLTDISNKKDARVK